ncbi:MAG: hypothetical protein F6K17_33070 [Okeania sp. SIO3C4]|nr:hypothetical protein [Okeania sp. SIO3C4]
MATREPPPPPSAQTYLPLWAINEIKKFDIIQLSFEELENKIVFHDFLIVLLFSAIARSARLVK